MEWKIETHVAENILRVFPSTLHRAEARSVTGVRELEILAADRKVTRADGESDVWERFRRGGFAGWNDPPTNVLVEFGAGNRRVNGLDGCIVEENQLWSSQSAR